MSEQIHTDTDTTPSPAPAGSDAAPTAESPPPSPEGDGAASTGIASATEDFADFTIPDGMTADPALADEFKALAKEFGLSQDAAQRLVDLYAERVGDLGQTPARLWAETQAQWRQKTRADPEIGGARFAHSLTIAKRAVDAFGGPALAEALTQTGAGNHPEVIRFFTRVGNALSEDAMVSPHRGGGRRNILDILYPNHPY
jgi:hypothetical protein